MRKPPRRAHPLLGRRVRGRRRQPQQSAGPFDGTGEARGLMMTLLAGGAISASAAEIQAYAGVVAGGITNQVSSSGTLSSTQSVTGPVASGQFIDTASSQAAFGALAVHATGSKDRATSNFNFDSAAAFARFQDELRDRDPVSRL